MGDVENYQCNIVCSPYRLLVAYVAKRLLALADHVWLLSTLEASGRKHHINENCSRVRKDQSPENLTVLRHIALNLPKATSVPNCSRLH